MKVHVDRTVCEEHGQCTIAAPTVFRMNDDGNLEYDTDFDDSLREEVTDAVDVCPVQAILLEGN